MVDKKVINLTEKATLEDADVLYIADNNGGGGFLDKKLAGTEIKKIKVSDNDTDAGVLNDKIDVTAALTKAIENASSDELLRLGIAISADSGNILELRSDGVYTDGNSTIDGYSVTSKGLSLSRVTTTTTNDTIRLSYEVLVVGTKRFINGTIDFVMPTNLDPASTQTNGEWYALNLYNNAGTLEAYLLMEGDTATISGTEVVQIGNAYFDSGAFVNNKFWLKTEESIRFNTAVDLSSLFTVAGSPAVQTADLSTYVPPETKAVLIWIKHVPTVAGQQFVIYDTSGSNIMLKALSENASSQSSENGDATIDSNRLLRFSFTSATSANIEVYLYGFTQSLI